MSPDYVNSRTRLTLALSALALILTALVYTGCSKGISGSGFQNSPPQARFVNVPPNGSTFSANPIISWIGSDIDGRVVEFRYVVVLSADIMSVGATPTESEALAHARGMSLTEWTVRTVTLNDPANSDTAKMTADFVNPVRNIIQQYFFLYAVDDKGAFSPIVYRLFGRNDHYPETGIIPFLREPYVNVQVRQFDRGGIVATWAGRDPLDYPGDVDAPLDYEWTLFGPYTKAESTLIIDEFTRDVFVTIESVLEIGDTLVDTLFDFTKADTLIDSIIGVDTFFGKITVAVDTVFTFEVSRDNASLLRPFGSFSIVVSRDSMDALDASYSPVINRTVESSFNPLTGDPWVLENTHIFLDVYRSDPLVVPGGLDDTTRERTFLFWVRSRDDAFVPDPTPSFGMFNVIEAKHEKDILVIDLSLIAPQLEITGNIIPCASNVDRREWRRGAEQAKRMFSEYIQEWRPGSIGGDASAGFDTGTFQPCGEDSILVPAANDCTEFGMDPGFTSPDYQLFNLPPVNPYRTRLRDILKHKVVIFVKEQILRPLPFNEGQSPQGWLVDGVLSGVNFWVMARAPFMERGFSELDPYPFATTPGAVPPIYSNIFGIEGGFFQAWYGMAVQRSRAGEPGEPVRTEDFVGAITTEFFSTTDFPELAVDPLRLEANIRWNDTLLCEYPRYHSAHYPYIDSIASLPEVGYTIPITTIGTESIYLYKSRFGEAKYPFFDLDIDNYEGTVVACRRDAGLFRSSHWQFAPAGLDSATFQVAFNSMMDWLFQPWGGPSFGRVPMISPRVEGDMSLFKKLAQFNDDRRQSELAEILPPGQTLVRNQVEYNRYLQPYVERKQAEEAARAGY